MKTLALSTAMLALVSGMAFAQTPPSSTETTTGTGQDQAPLTGQTGSPSAPQVRDTGDEGGDPAVAAPDAEAPDAMAPADQGMSGMSSGSGNMNDPAMPEASNDAGMTPPEGYAPLGADMMNADAIMDATVYDSNDSEVGEISAVMPESGMPQQVVIDVGGFLGIGEKPVSLNVSELMFYKETDGDSVRAYTTMTQEQIEDLPEYEG